MAAFKIGGDWRVRRVQIEQWLKMIAQFVVSALIISSVRGGAIAPRPEG
jgi:hypothetical protein